MIGISKSLDTEVKSVLACLSESKRQRIQLIEFESVVHRRNKSIDDANLHLGEWTPADLMEGDVHLRTVRALLTQIDRLGYERSLHQVEFHDSFLRACARIFYRTDWLLKQPQILLNNGWKKSNSEVLISTPRRFGYDFKFLCFFPTLHTLYLFSITWKENIQRRHVRGHAAPVLQIGSCRVFSGTQSVSETTGKDSGVRSERREKRERARERERERERVAERSLPTGRFVRILGEGDRIMEYNQENCRIRSYSGGSALVRSFPSKVGVRLRGVCVCVRQQRACVFPKITMEAGSPPPTPLEGLRLQRPREGPSAPKR